MQNNNYLLIFILLNNKIYPTYFASIILLNKYWYTVLINIDLQTYDNCNKLIYIKFSRYISKKKIEEYK